MPSKKKATLAEPNKDSSRARGRTNTLDRHVPAFTPRAYLSSPSTCIFRQFLFFCSQGGDGFIPPHPRIRNIPFSFLPLTHLFESMTQTREPRRAIGSTDNRSLYLFLRYIFAFLLFITRGYQPCITALSSPDFRRHSSLSRLGIDCGGRGKLEVA